MIKPKKRILLIKKHKNTAIKADIVIEEQDEDKRLITGEVLSEDNTIYAKGDTVIFGKYALFQLTIKGVDYHLLSEDDVLGVCNYKE